MVGGCALSLLGSSRPTIDIDFIGDDVHPNGFHRALLQLASELNLYMKAVPLDRFIPLPDGSDSRAIQIGQFGNLEVEKVTQKALEKAREFDMNSTEVIAHFQELKKRL